MNFYDELLEHNQYEKDENENAIHSVTTALVKENWDEEHPGMVKIEFFLGEEGENLTEWVQVASCYAGNKFGVYALPEIGSEVVVAFNMGDRNCPIIIGTLWNNKNALPDETANENNTIKRIKTKGGHEIIFSEEEGKEQIEMKTPGKLRIALADEKKQITITNEEGKNGIAIDMENGLVKVDAEEKILLSVGGTAMVTLDGCSKTVTIKTDNIKLEAAQGLTMKGQNLKIEGNMLNMKADSSLKIESSAIAEVKGSMVKIN